MIRRLIIRAQAETDIAEAAAWYESRFPGLAGQFLAELDSALRRTLANPQMSLCLRRRPEVRRTLTHRFPYRVFFILQPDAIIVIRILHTARHERQWRQSV